MQLFLIRQLSLFYLVSLHGWVACMLFEKGGGNRGERRPALAQGRIRSCCWPGCDGEIPGRSRMRCCCFSLLRCASGPCVSSYNFGFREYSNFTISWIFLPFIYSCLLFILIEAQADTELRLKKKKVQANTCSFFLRYFHSFNIQTLLLLIKLS